jgi:methionyl-tRNA formyltransferase
LLAESFEVEAVVTKPKPAHHRSDFPVVSLAESKGLKLIYAGTKAELTEAFKSKPVASKIGIVIDYGVIIAKEVIDYFPLGIVNSHFSLLPQWRGADPISFAVLSGQNRTGVSLMLINERMDEGKILAQGVYDMADYITTPRLTGELIKLSDALLVHYLPMYMSGEVTAVTQAAAAKAMGLPIVATYSRKLTKEDGRIDWTKPAAQIEAEIRAYIEWPRSYTTLFGREVIITSARIPGGRPETVDRRQEPGQTLATDTKQLLVETSDGVLEIVKLKPTGKNEMTAKEFLAGYGKDL